MIYLSDKQIRNVYFVKDEKKSSISDLEQALGNDANVGNFYPSNVNGKVSFYIAEPARLTAGCNIVRTDTIDSIKDVKSITISKQKGTELKKWTITLGTNITNTTIAYHVGETFKVNFDFTNWYGVGNDHFYHKFAVVYIKSGMKTTDFYAALKKQIESQFMRESYNPFTVSGGTTNVVITEKQQYTNVDMMVDMQSISCDITCDEIKSIDSNGNWDGTYVNWGTVAKTVASTLANGYQMKELYHAAFKGRSDMYGYLGFPNVNPSVEPNIETGTNYVTVDVVYVKRGSGVDIEEQIKEMTFVCENESRADEICSTIGVSTGTLYTSAGATASKPLNSSLSAGDYIIADL